MKKKLILIPVISLCIFNSMCPHEILSGAEAPSVSKNKKLCQIIDMLQKIENCCQQVSSTTCQTEITDLPFTIMQPGLYCVNTSLTVPCASDPSMNFGIKIAASNVTLRFYPGGSISKTTSQFGIIDDISQNLSNINIEDAIIINSADTICIAPVSATPPAAIQVSASLVTINNPSIVSTTPIPQSVGISVLGSQAVHVSSPILGNLGVGVMAAPNTKTMIPIPTSNLTISNGSIGATTGIILNQVNGGVVLNTPITVIPGEPINTPVGIKGSGGSVSGSGGRISNSGGPVKAGPSSGQKNKKDSDPTTIAIQLTGCSFHVYREMDITGFTTGILIEDDTSSSTPVPSIGNSVITGVISHCDTAINITGTSGSSLIADYYFNQNGLAINAPAGGVGPASTVSNSTFVNSGTPPTSGLSLEICNQC